MRQATTLLEACNQKRYSECINQYSDIDRNPIRPLQTESTLK